MTEMKYIKELIQTGTGTEGSVLIERRIHDVLIDEVDKAVIPRSEAAMYFGPSDMVGQSSYDINLVDENTMDVRLISEGAEVFIDAVEQSGINIKPDKYGVGIRITSEMLEDAKWNLLQLNARFAGKRMAENENSLVISQALDNAGNTVSGGAAITIANITRAMQYLDDNDYSPTTLFVGMEVLADLRNIDTFVEANKVGNTEMLTRGFLGNIYGLNVIKVSTNAGMTTTSSYVTDRQQAYVLVEKRPVTVETFNLPTHDLQGATITQRIRARQLRSNAIAKITTS